MTADHTALFLFDLAIVLVASRLASAAAHRVKQPAVIGEILVGVLLGPSLMHGAITDALFPTDVRQLLGALADLGVVLFMLVIGLELDQGKVGGNKRLVAGVCASATGLPLVLGMLLAIDLLGEHPTARPVGFVLFVGVAMSVTAFPVLARILVDHGMDGTVLGSVALACAAVCDVVAWLLLAAVVALAGGSGQAPWQVTLLVPYLIILVTLVRPGLRRLFRRGQPDGWVLTVTVTGALVSGGLTDWMGLHFIFGAFLFGAVCRAAGGRPVAGVVSRNVKQLNTLLFLPAFFVTAGLRVDLSRVDLSGLGELGLIVLVAVVGKFAGTFVGARVYGMPTRSAAALGALMNTRGLTELIALVLGLQLGLIDNGLYALMVVMALVTTAMTGPALRLLAVTSEGGEREFHC
jgi:Kef-type K+ transport system membrane component KefB